MQLTIHQGSHKIGGNCVEIRSGSSRIILDVGMPLFNSDGEPFDEKGIQGKSVPELLDEKILPNIPGLFAERPPVDAILLSHAHMDHTGFLPYTTPEIPVYATKATSQMMLAGRLFARQVELPGDRYRELIAGEPIRIGDFQVTSFSVDHSAYGSIAILVESESSTILYSGDLRLHGRKPGMAENLVNALKNTTVDALLMEGTAIGNSRKGITEAELEKEAVGHIQNSGGLVLASFSPQHLDRLVGFYRTAKQTDRIFVVDVYTAFILSMISGDVQVPGPTRSSGIRVFYPALIQREHRRRRLGKVYDRFLDNQIEVDEILSEPSKNLMLFRPSMFDTDFGGQLPQGTLCLFSRWQGYLEQPEWQPIKKAIAAANGQLILTHTSGHIFTEDMIDFVQNVNPKTVIPIHTFNPEEYSKHFTNTCVLTDGETIEV